MLTKPLRVPDFFLVGAPKCGTTAMNRYLGQHPQIFVPPRKEFHYFGSDLQWRRPSVAAEAYFRHFQQVDFARRVGEASVWYLYSERAAREIKACNPEGRIIAMLRDPMEMIPAVHSQLLRIGEEFILDLPEALDAERDREAGHRLPPKDNPGAAQLLFYSRIARYSEQVQRYFDAFGHDRVHIILYDDLKTQPDRTYQDVLRFLKVDVTFQPEFVRINANRQIQKPWLWRLTKFPPTSFRKIWRAVLPTDIRKLVLTYAANRYTNETPREALSKGTRRRLCDMYADDVARLAKLLARDLSHWLEGQQ